MSGDEKNSLPVQQFAADTSIPRESLRVQAANKSAAGTTIRAIRRLVARFNATRFEAEKILRQLNELSDRIRQQAPSRRSGPAA